VYSVVLHFAAFNCELHFPVNSQDYRHSCACKILWTSNIESGGNSHRHFQTYSKLAELTLFHISVDINNFDMLTSEIPIVDVKNNKNSNC